MNGRDRHKPPRRRGLPPGQLLRPDNVLLWRELPWTAGVMLTAGASGWLTGAAEAAAVAAAIGFLAQQLTYRALVQTLWLGWQTRAVAYNDPEIARKQIRLTLRAFTIWMRSARAADQLYIALWNVRGDDTDYDDNGEDDTATRPGEAEMRVTDSYVLAVRLGDSPYWCDSIARRRLRATLQRDEQRLLRLCGRPKHSRPTK